jgi:hypothetical protein
MGDWEFLDEPDQGSGNPVVAPTFDNELWEQLRREQLGVHVVDPLGHHIGDATAMNHRPEDSSRSRNWQPLDPDKQVLVGQLEDFYVSDTHAKYGEWDWNICLAPDPYFSRILAEQGPGYLVECEITPPEGIRLVYLESPYRDLMHKKLGVYGPWVSDLGNNYQPEIHPCEAIWWTSPGLPVPDSTRSVFVAVLQDDSDRFDISSDYDGQVPRPWCAFPRRANIMVALRLRAQDHLYLNLSLPLQRELASMGDPGAVVTRAFDGRTVVTVTKQFARPETVRMGLGPVARDPDGVHLRCFLYLAIQAGIPSSRERQLAGYAVLQLWASAPYGWRPPDSRVPPGGQPP